MPGERQLVTESQKRSPDLVDVPVGGKILALSPVADAFALAVVAADLPRRKAFSGWLSRGDETGRVECSRIGVPGQADRHLLFIRPRRGEKAPGDGRLVLQVSGRRAALDPEDLSQVVLPIEGLCAQHLAGLELDARQAVLEQVISHAHHHCSVDRKVAEGLRTVRDATRQPLPLGDLDSSAACAVNVDGLWRLDDCSFYVEGWLLERGSKLRRLTILTPEGRSIDILDGAFRYPRADVAEFFGVSAREKLGFIAYVETPEPTVLSSSWILQARDSNGGGIEIEMPELSEGGVDLRTMILHDVKLEPLSDEALKIGHIRPALSRLEKRLADTVEIDTVDQHGNPPAQPEVTIVVPLYHQLEFLEQQMAQFVHDPEIGTTDLVYVLDSPEDADYLRPLADQLFRLYGVPFRLATLSANGGFSVANNLGASLGGARMLLLLNSDILPAESGWLSRMVRFYDSNPAIGALAPKLLYEDDSIQHAGLYFDRPPGAPVWSNEHYYKGLHRTFAKANVASSVPAVTGACLLISAELFRSLGGLTGLYIRGDYEDSDLCLRLRDMGREAWYLPDVELYHLEGQSYPSQEREAASQYNQWLHTHRWRAQLSEIESAAT